MGQKRGMMVMMVMTSLRMQDRSRYILPDLACLALCNELVAASSTSMLSTNNQDLFQFYAYLLTMVSLVVCSMISL